METRNLMKPHFNMLVGLPGSGKSYIAALFKEQQVVDGLECVIHSSDAIREELTGDVNNQNINSKVFEVLHKRVREDLLAGRNVIYDTTNLNWKRRKAFVQSLNKIDCYKICNVIATPFEICVEQNNSRERVVPYDVMKKMHKNFDIPWYNEGWDTIQIFYPNETYRTKYGTTQQYLKRYMGFNQSNPHHNMTLSEHCEATKEYICKTLLMTRETLPKQELINAAILHDCGKPACQTFVNKKGEESEWAHYYDHEHVGCYDSLFYEKDGNVLLTAVLIRWHMMMHFRKDWKPTTNEKYFKEFNTDDVSKRCNLWLALEMLHSADTDSH